MKDKKLDELSNTQLKDFSGVNISGVTRETANKITGLEQKDAIKFLNQLFSSTSKEGIVKLDDKVVLYKINSSKMGEYNKSKDDIVKSNLLQLQEDELMTNLIKKLENNFKIESLIKNKE